MLDASNDDEVTIISNSSDQEGFISAAPSPFKENANLSTTSDTENLEFRECAVNKELLFKESEVLTYLEVRAFMEQSSENEFLYGWENCDGGIIYVSPIESCVFWQPANTVEQSHSATENGVSKAVKIMSTLSLSNYEILDSQVFGLGILKGLNQNSQITYFFTFNGAFVAAVESKQEESSNFMIPTVKNGRVVNVNCGQHKYVFDTDSGISRQYKYFFQET